MHQLLLHPDCAEGPIKAVRGDIEFTDEGFVARFTLSGDVDQIVLPDLSGLSADVHRDVRRDVLGDNSSDGGSDCSYDGESDEESDEESDAGSNRKSDVHESHSADTLRRDNLWQSTCFEIFCEGSVREDENDQVMEGGDNFGKATRLGKGAIDQSDAPYREYNFSPSGAWACYDFETYRQGANAEGIEAVTITSSLTKKLPSAESGKSHDSGGKSPFPAEQEEVSYCLEARVKSQFPLPKIVGINAILLVKEGGFQYWAMAHPPGKPDFHLSAGRILMVAK